jgi:hypothetical protein
MHSSKSCLSWKISFSSETLFTTNIQRQSYARLKSFAAYRILRNSMTNLPVITTLRRKHNGRMGSFHNFKSASMGKPTNPKINTIQKKKKVLQHWAWTVSFSMPQNELHELLLHFPLSHSPVSFISDVYASKRNKERVAVYPCLKILQQADYNIYVFNH